MDKNKEVTEFIKNTEKEQQGLLTVLRDLIIKAVPEATEQFKWSRPVYAADKDFCYLKTAKNHINLGFFNFEKIEDPEGLLGGTGKQMRHIKISTKEDIKVEVFTKMLQQAAVF